MKPNMIDLSSLIKYLVPAAILVVVLVYLFLRKFIVSYVELRNRVQISEKAAKMRQGNTGKVEPVIVRRTDLYDQLNPQQKLIHKQAEDLAVQKNFREAARLFESINFQRKAIDLLEFNGFIEEAAQTLLRMKVPYRAAIIYERNSQFTRAAECFTLDEKHDNAARSYEKAAAKDFHYYKNAGVSYSAAGMIDQCLEAYAKILLSEEIVKIAFRGGKFEFLATYMADPYNAKFMLEQFTGEQLRVFIEAITLRPSFVQSMSVWVLYRHDLDFFNNILFRLIDREDLTKLFWSHISGAYITHLHQSLTKSPSAFQRETYEYHGKILINLNRGPLGELFTLNAASLPPTTSPSPASLSVPNWEVPK